MIKKICGRCNQLYTGYKCPNCTKERNKRYNKYERDQERNAVYGGAWESTKLNVLARDKGMCQMCYSIDKRLNFDYPIVHHIVPVEDDQSLWYDNNNLITVCAKHHQFIHKQYHVSITEKKRMQSRLRAMIEWE